MSFNLSMKCVIAGLLLFMAVHVIAEAKTFTRRICKTSDLRKDDHVTVVKGDVLIAEYFCHEGDCSNTPNTVGRLTEQAGDLVLIIQNINPLDRCDAYRWDRSGKTLLLKNFTLDEVLPTTATPDLTDEALNPSITQTDLLIITSTGVLTGIGVLAVVAALLTQRDLRSRAVTSFRRMCYGPPEHQQQASPTENFLPNPEQPLTTPAISTKDEETLGTNETNTTVSEERNHRITYSITGVLSGGIVVFVVSYRIKKKQNNPIAADPEDPGEDTSLDSNTDGAGEADTGEALEMVVVDPNFSVDNEEGPVHGA